MNTPKFYMKRSQVWENSYSVFERNRLNEFGEPYCVDPGLSYEEARRRVEELNSESQAA